MHTFKQAEDCMQVVAGRTCKWGQRHKQKLKYAWHDMEGLKECVGDGLQTVLPCRRSGNDAAVTSTTHATCVCDARLQAEQKRKNAMGSLACRHLQDGACWAQ